MDKVIELPDRLRKIIDYYGLSVNELAAKLGGSRMKYYNLLNGKAKPDFDTTECILKSFPDVSAEWFMRGDGSMLKSQIATTEEMEKIRNENVVLQSLYEKAAAKISILGKTKGAIISLDKGKEIRILTAKTLLANSRRTGRNGKSKTLSVRVQGAVIPSILNNLN
jgi:transcriptional regulator with XRE-family HTH domain